MARTYRNVWSPALVRISYPPRCRGDSWSSISLDPAMARLAETLWGARWKEEVRQLAVFLADADPHHTSISRAVQARIAEAAIQRLKAHQAVHATSHPTAAMRRCGRAPW